MINKVIRIHKKNAAFVYAIFESLDGMVSFSTLPGTDSLYCDLHLMISEGYTEEVAAAIEAFQKEFPVLTLTETA